MRGAATQSGFAIAIFGFDWEKAGVLWLTLSLTAPLLPAEDPIDFAALDQAIARCERTIALPIFAREPERRSAFLTSVYQEQWQITKERKSVAERRRSIREHRSGLSGSVNAASPSVETDQDLALMQLALDDRQNDLDARRRLETLRQQALDIKRDYFLTKCSFADAKR